MSEPAPGLSLVLPVHNERESLPPLFDQIAAAVQAAGVSAEVIFVDDGSRDGSWDVIRDLAARDPRVRGVRFRRNFGKAAALQAGFEMVRAPRVITLDADLQDDPAEIPNFLKQLDQGYDLVSGWKKVRHDPWHKVFPSHVFNAIVSWMSRVQLHDHNCGMKAYEVAVIREVRLYGEMHRFIPVLAAAKGFRVGELVIHHRPRQFGRSKYGAKRFLRGFLDMLTVNFLTRYGRRPMHLLGGAALAVGLAALVIAVVGLFWHPAMSAWTLLGIVFAVLGPLVLFLHGLQAELTASTRTDPPFSIVDWVG
ncbi:MAG TPA: glycosyltransferase family 2 protein [Gemmataceae bacterium]|nr:glycosyltransferase family 2 protein [Gemmataceae bacterium]